MMIERISAIGLPVLFTLCSNILFWGMKIIPAIKEGKEQAKEVLTTYFLLAPIFILPLFLAIRFLIAG